MEDRERKRRRETKRNQLSESNAKVTEGRGRSKNPEEPCKRREGLEDGRRNSKKIEEQI
jgi:hypothetical protein